MNHVHVIWIFMHLICIYLYHILITRIVYITIDTKYEAYNRSVDIKHQKSDWPQVLVRRFKLTLMNSCPAAAIPWHRDKDASFWGRNWRNRMDCVLFGQAMRCSVQAEAQSPWDSKQEKKSMHGFASNMRLCICIYRNYIYSIYI